MEKLGLIGIVSIKILLRYFAIQLTHLIEAHQLSCSESVVSSSISSTVLY